jgi:hypothetical protein
MYVDFALSANEICSLLPLQPAAFPYWLCPAVLAGASSTMQIGRGGEGQAALGRL